MSTEVCRKGLAFNQFCALFHSATSLFVLILHLQSVGPSQGLGFHPAKDRIPFAVLDNMYPIRRKIVICDENASLLERFDLEEAYWF